MHHVSQIVPTCPQVALTSILINVVRSKGKAYETRSNGALWIHWNFAYCPTGNVQVRIFTRGEFVSPFRRPFSATLLSLSCRF